MKRYRKLAIVVATGVTALGATYVGSYFKLVSPSYAGTADYFGLSNRDHVYAVHFFKPVYESVPYIADGDTWTTIFSPIHRIDRALRPNTWDSLVQFVANGQHEEVRLSEFRRRYPQSASKLK